MYGSSSVTNGGKLMTSRWTGFTGFFKIDRIYLVHPEKSCKSCLLKLPTINSHYERSPTCLCSDMKSKLFQASTIFPFSIRTIVMPVISTGA